MNSEQSKKLRVGSIVSTDSLPEGEYHEGEVVEARSYAVKIKWGDGYVGCIDHRDMSKINCEP